MDKQTEQHVPEIVIADMQRQITELQSMTQVLLSAFIGLLDQLQKVFVTEIDEMTLMDTLEEVYENVFADMDE